MKKPLTTTLLHPPKWVFLLSPVIFAALGFVFLNDLQDSAPAYIIYCLSAYFLTVLVIPLPRLFRRAKLFARRLISKNRFGKEYLDDRAFRAKVSVLQGMVMNFFYVIFRAVVGIRYMSVWFISMAIYYLILGLIRLMLMLSLRNPDAAAGLRCYRRTAVMLFLLNIPMGGMMILMVLTDSGFSYPEYVTYLSALYTFYTVIMSIVDLVRFRRIGDPVLSAAKALNFVAALMSVLGLQTAMIAQFSQNGDDFRRMMNAITGGFVWVTVIMTAVYMLVRCKRIGGRQIEPLGK